MTTIQEKELVRFNGEPVGEGVRKTREATEKLESFPFGPHAGRFLDGPPPDGVPEGELFPEEPTDPSEKVDYPVEKTVGVMGAIKQQTRKRAWRYLKRPEGIRPEEMDTYIRGFYEVKETYASVIDHAGDMWAVWTSEEKPEYGAFEEKPVPSAGSEQVDETAKNADWKMYGKTLETTVCVLCNTPIEPGGLVVIRSDGKKAHEPCFAATNQSPPKLYVNQNPPRTQSAGESYRNDLKPLLFAAADILETWAARLRSKT